MFMLPFHPALAGMIGTDQAMAAATAQSERAAVLSMIDRADVARELSTMGVDPDAARLRVAAMSDNEVHTLACRLDTLPAGADGAGWVIAALIIAGVIYYFYVWR